MSYYVAVSTLNNIAIGTPTLREELNNRRHYWFLVELKVPYVLICLLLLFLIESEGIRDPQGRDVKPTGRHLFQGHF